MIATSPDGQWAAIRRGREVALLANGAGPATARIELDTDDADLIIVGPPSVLVIVTRAADGASMTDHNRSSGGKGPPASLVGGNPVGTNRLVLYLPPYLDAVAQLDLEVAMRIAAVTGPRIALVSLDGKAVTIVRVAGRALSAQALDTGSPVEFAVGLERNQVLFSLLRKLEAWDAVSGRPLLRMQLQLPPPPRIVGPAHGHLWAMRAGSDDILVCRLSDGRPFQHHLGAPIDEVVCHPASPLLILVTSRGLVRLHCFAHSLTAIDAPWQPGVPLAQLVVGKLIDRFPLKTIYIPILLLQVPLFLIASQVQDWALFITAIAFMLLVFGAIPFTDAMIVKYIDDRMRSRVTGARLAIGFGVSSFVVALMGPTVKAAGFPTLLMALAVVAFCSFLAISMLPAEHEMGKAALKPAE
jgi:hypothetical protein